MAVIPPPPCPDCQQPMATLQENRKWVCEAHGWYARLEDRTVVKSFYLKRQRFTFGPGEVGTNFRALMPKGRPQFRYLFYQLVGAPQAPASAPQPGVPVDQPPADHGGQHPGF